MGDIQFRLRGEVDLANADEIRHALLAAISGGVGDLCIDCVDLAFIDSSGIRVLIEIETTLQEGNRRVFLVNVGRGPRRVFEMLGLTELLQVRGEPPTSDQPPDLAH